MTIVYNQDKEQVEANWKKQTSTEKTEKISPYWREKTSSIDGNIKTLYEFNAENNTYFPIITDLEPSMEEEPVGLYGLKWIDMMEKNYFPETQILKLQHKFLSVAREVQRTAEDYRDILENQYEEYYPRPKGSFEKVVQWARTKQFEADSSVMREVVLQPYTVEMLRKIEKGE